VREANTEAQLLRAMAFHEAGHAVVSVIERIPLKRVTCRPGQDFLGACEHPPWDLPSPDVTWNEEVESRLRGHIRLLFAGVIAEVKSTGTAEWNLAGFEGDKDTIGDLVLRIGGDSDSASAICEQECEATTGLVSKHWKAIEAVAEALLVRKELSPQEVSEIVGKY
jgi:ATP-dependent Zn protease